MEFRDYFIMAIVCGLFIISMVSFVSNLQSSNNAGINVNQNPFLSKLNANVSGQLGNLQSQTDANRGQLASEESNSIPTAIGFSFKAILDSGNIFISNTINLLYSIIYFMQQVFFVNSIIAGTIIGLIIGLLILGVWSLIRAGR